MFAYRNVPEAKASWQKPGHEWSTGALQGQARRSLRPCRTVANSVSCPRPSSVVVTMSGRVAMPTVFVADPIEALRPYAEERRVAAAAGAEFLIGDDVPPRVRDAEIILVSSIRVTAEIRSEERRVGKE